jgi:hypothetical protein
LFALIPLLPPKKQRPKKCAEIEGWLTDQGEGRVSWAGSRWRQGRKRETPARGASQSEWPCPWLPLPLAALLAWGWVDPLSSPAPAAEEGKEEKEEKKGFQAL